jgi:hypothetical protein
VAYSKRSLDLLDCYALNLNCFHRHILRPSFRRLGLPLLSVGLKRNRKLKGCEHKEIFSGDLLIPLRRIAHTVRLIQSFLLFPSVKETNLATRQHLTETYQQFLS